MSLEIDNEKLFSATLAFRIYDYFTENTKVEYIWRKRWSFGKINFLFNRYLRLSALSFSVLVWSTSILKPEICEAYYNYATGLLNIFAYSVAQDLLPISLTETQLYAMYDCNTNVAFLTGSLFVVEMMATILLCFTRISKASNLNPELPTSLQCARRFRSHSLQHTLSGVPLIVFESLLIGMTLLRAYTLYEDGTRQPFLRLVIRDSFLLKPSTTLTSLGFFPIITTHFSIFTFGPIYNQSFALGWLFAVPCVVGSRLLLHMHVQAFGRYGTLPELQTHGEIHRLYIVNGEYISSPSRRMSEMHLAPPKSWECLFEY
ncbi:hypothetical protein M422DRAFT_52856 [Sphaerobolus stellatus SS14]|uniref:Unplaced genomic scaffold SPHSTscaffold_152, whole genome shotgun sequence n=1 Tax=Sphaerobolus stellatus (strain SS14) TaxID=990650 RepID=A0A0C9TQN1_SPHS4|nr:hypothetical protein M422DRAFT_52856 [Sphaerobolus stellatus SS14]